jgi:mitogen-activated protein kinase kinase kinase 1
MKLIKKSSKPRTPKLQRLNAVKNFDYVISPDSSFSSPESSHHARSLDPTSAPSTSSNPDFSSITSFRIHGSGKEEIELLCRSLGLSGTDDFGISVEAWEAAHRSRSIDESSSHDESTPVVCSTTNKDEPRVLSGELGYHEESDRVGEDLAVVLNDYETLIDSNFSNKNYSGERGINGIRPPQLTTSRMHVSFESKEEIVGPVQEDCHSCKEDASRVSENASGGDNCAHKRSNFPLAPPPCMSLPKYDHKGTESIWDLVLSFGPEGRKHEEYNGFYRDGKTRNQSIDLDEEDDEEIDGFRSGEMTEGFTGTSSLSTTNDDETSSTSTEAMFVVSPNGRFKRKIRSWMRGVMLGHGSFGMVYEGISE